MTTRACPSCGAQYVASVSRCADCDTELVDALDDDAAEQLGLGDADPADQMTYELDDWSGDARVVLDGMLTSEGIAHVWEIGTLVVRAVDEERVDELVDRVESTELPTLDPDADQVVYEISGWSEAQRSDLEAALLAEDIPHGIDSNGDLVVLEADEDRVEPILDRVDMEDVLSAEQIAADGDDEADVAATAAADDGLAAQDAMSDLFITADRLMKDPDDRDDIARLAAAADRAAALPLPYGFSPAVWDDINAKAAELRHLLVGSVSSDADADAGVEADAEDDDADADQDDDAPLGGSEPAVAGAETNDPSPGANDRDTVVEAARALRQTLRQYV